MSRLVPCRFLLWCAAFAVACAFLFSSSARAVIPVWKTDEELAREPIVVVAKWNRTPLKVHELVDGNVSRHSEAHTEIVVECVLEGNVKLGKNQLLLDRDLGWEKKGGPIISYTSTMMYGDIEEVGEPNLWFLTRKKSWDEKDKHEYLYVSTFRNVQPLALKPYFEALLSEDPPTKMADAFRSPEPLVLERCLKFTAGGEWPWPFIRPEDIRIWGLKPGPPVAALTTEIERLLDNPTLPERPRAAAVYAEIAGAKSLPRLRKLLDDKNPQARAMAIALLAKRRDGESCEAMCRAAADIEDGLLGCAIVEAVGEWKDERLVPVLISSLQNDARSYRNGDGLGIPALNAQETLTRIVGYTFPFDVRASLKAWDRAKAIRDPKERRKLLAEVLPFNPQPLEASYIYGGGQLAVTVTNASERPVTLTKLPPDIDITYERGSSGRSHWGDDGDARSFVTLTPGRSWQFKVDFERPAPPIQVRIAYTHNGNDVGENAWLGIIEMKPAKSETKSTNTPNPANK